MSLNINCIKFHESHTEKRPCQEKRPITNAWHSQEYEKKKRTVEANTFWCGEKWLKYSFGKLKRG